jgi:chitin synthase
VLERGVLSAAAIMSFVNNSRMSVYSTASAANPQRGGIQSTTQSTTTLLNLLNSSFKTGQPYSLEPSTSLVVNTWVNAKTMENGRIGGTVDLELVRKTYEHARRRVEDGTLVLRYVVHAVSATAAATLCSC